MFWQRFLSDFHSIKEHTEAIVFTNLKLLANLARKKKSVDSQINREARYSYYTQYFQRWDWLCSRLG